MTNNKTTVTLDCWIKKANGFYQTAKFLDNPIIEISYNIDSITSSWYLLHHSIELFLKAILINYNGFNSATSKIHDLNKLAEKVDGLDQKIDFLLKEVKDNRSIKQWISFINPFGFPNGGIRYNQPDKGLYAAPLGISCYFSDLIETIKENCDLKKEIDKALLR